jgi:uncharacterized protein YggT (Ycf19 family)
MAIVRRNYSSPLGIILMLFNLIFGLILLLLGLRIILLLFGANTSSGFVSFIYNASQPFVAPFRGIFPSQYLGSGFFIDTAAILAFIVYGLVLSLINFALGRYDGDTVVERDREL